MEICGSAAAVFAKARQSAEKPTLNQCHMPVLSAQPLASPWRMRRENLVNELEGYGVPVHPRWTVPELRQTLIEQREVRFPKGESNPATGLTKLKLEELIAKAKELDIEVPVKPTRGLLLKMIRESIQPPGEHVMTFGKYRSWLYQEVPEEYMDWAVKEVRANSNSSPDLRLFAKWAQDEMNTRKNRAKSRGLVLPAEDPEVKAVIDPPDVSSVRSWRSSVSQASTLRSTGKDKRQLEETIEELNGMQPDLTEEDKEELMKLETKLAAMRQKYQLAPRGSPQ